MLSPWKNILLKKSSNTMTLKTLNPSSHTDPIHNHPSYESVQLASKEVKGERPF